MRFVITLLLMLSMPASSLAGTGDSTAQRRILAVESSLPALGFEAGPQLSQLGQSPGSSDILERMKHYGLPGVSVVVIDAHAIVWTRAYGLLSLERPEVVEPNSLFEAGSVSKSLTALALLQLVDQGKLDLDGAANAYMDSWQIPASDLTASAPVTLRGLLTHTAGINRPDGGFGVEEGKSPSLLQVLNGEAPALNAPVSLDFAPGDGHQYSNFGYIILQQLISDQTGKPFAAHMESEILPALGMPASRFDPATPERHPAKVAWPHTEEGEAVKPAPHPSALAQGGLWTTPTDLGRLVLDLMSTIQGRKRGLLSQDLVKAALSPQLALDPAQWFGFRGQGLGFFLLETESGMGFCNAGYNEPGATCILIGFPETGQGAVVMTNGAGGLFFSFELLSSIATVYEWPEIK